MKIYQIHEWGGEWEDRYDYIVGSYLLEEKAIAEKERLEAEEKEAAKCNICPLYFCEPDCNGDCEDCDNLRIDKAKKYCDRYKQSDYGKCENFYLKLYDGHFNIEEVEVIE